VWVVGAKTLSASACDVGIFFLPPAHAILSRSCTDYFFSSPLNIHFGYQTILLQNQKERKKTAEIMSEFQIPGLGQAKPNETLPPLPADLQAAADGANGHEEAPDAPIGDAPQQITADNDNNKPEQTAQEATQPDADAMVIDRPESPPSLTQALEAAIGGLDAPTQQQQQSSQPQPPPPQGEMMEIPLQNDTSEHPEWEIDSSPYESSSSSSVSSSSDDDDSDNDEDYELLGVEETARLLMEAEGGSDDEGQASSKGNAASATAHLRTKNELQDDILPRPAITITPEMPLEQLGAIEHIVDSVILVKAITPGEYQVLDTGSVLCTADRAIVGAVSETIGKVTQPLYTVRFSSADEIQQLGLQVGTTLYYTPQHASFVFTEPLKGIKGSDASNLYDEEAGDEEMEFSDDEKEAEYKRAQKQKKKDRRQANGATSSSTSAGGKSTAKDTHHHHHHPLRQAMNADGSLNYDDDDGPYKPLARPSSLASGPGAAESSYEPQPRSGFHGRGKRGDSRGRGGNRGRGRGGSSRGGYDTGYSLPPQGQQQQSYAAPPPPPQASSMPQGSFGMQFPGWPQPGSNGQAVHSPPPPPPGWNGQQPGQGMQMDPAVLMALVSQIQAQSANGGQPPA
jgi:H/ACA ribonucleoprotein complex non-core subunit NAF1